MKPSKKLTKLNGLTSKYFHILPTYCTISIYSLCLLFEHCGHGCVV